MSHTKVLYLVRHAKSSWANPDLSDRMRPLNERGQRDAPRMGKRLAKRIERPQLIVSSPALRALTTANLIAQALGYGPEDIHIDEQIYTFNAADLADSVRRFDSQLDRIMLVGHNPAVTRLVNDLSDANIDNIPTGGVVTLELDVASWRDIGQGNGRMLDFDFPKKKLKC